MPEEKNGCVVGCQLAHIKPEDGVSVTAQGYTRVCFDSMGLLQVTARCWRLDSLFNLHVSLIEVSLIRFIGRGTSKAESLTLETWYSYANPVNRHLDLPVAYKVLRHYTSCSRPNCTYFHPPKHIRDQIIARRHAQYLREKQTREAEELLTAHPFSLLTQTPPQQENLFPNVHNLQETTNGLQLTAGSDPSVQHDAVPAQSDDASGRHVSVPLPTEFLSSDYRPERLPSELPLILRL
ncbi:unnamed protein product [Dibothriocephalus latus]|uniref:Muscleblind-like CCCH zinc finger domain-containing protein n=1 Tax=Dibothriocephalus latus TaxID=60516 RepID=A0A3P7LQF0_DIBLA|nr:unnamed protein product [Dibothriocephalus latus]